MKIVVKLVVLVTLVSSIAMAGGYGQQGPKGDKGDKGDPGQSITGPAGSDGRDGQDSTGGWQGYLGAGVRVLDSKYASLNGFALKNVRHDGGIVGAMVFFTPWKSAADRRADALEKRIADQERMIVKMRAESIPVPVVPGSGSVTDPATQTLTIRGR